VNDINATSKPIKAQYATPVLTNFGHVKQLTKATGTIAGDAGTMML
jgi:hypothetical protein